MSEAHDTIIEEICDYVDRYEIKEMLKEYLKRVVLEKPNDPLQFLIQTIRDKPYISATETAEREEEEEQAAAEEAGNVAADGEEEEDGERDE